MKAIRPRRPKPAPGRVGRRGAAGQDPWEIPLADRWRTLKGIKGSGPLSEKELDLAGRDLLALQRGLTGERGLVGAAYMDEADRLGAYLLFYWPVSRAQVRGMLDMAYPEGPGPAFAGRPLRILDLGAGPGPCGIAAAEWAAAVDGSGGAAGISVVACDRSAAALDCGARLAAAAGFGYETRPAWRAGTDPIPPGPFDLIILGHLLNEMHAADPRRTDLRLAFLEDAASRLAETGALVALEPALLSTGRDMLALRDRMTAKGWTAAAPCFRDGPCPALGQEGHTCHSDFTWSPNAQVRALVERTGLDKDLVKTTAFVFVRAGKTRSLPGGSGGIFRVVSEPMLNKAGRLRLLICGEAGRFPLSAKPGEGFPAEATFKQLRRSDAVEVRNAVPRETGWALGADTMLLPRRAKIITPS